MRDRTTSVAFLAAIALLLAACGSGGAETEAFCEDYIAVNTAINEGPGDDPEAWVTQVSDDLTALSTDAPSEVASAAEGVANALLAPIAAMDEEGFFAATESEEYVADVTVINDFVTSECDVAAVEVTAIDYAFDADLDSLEAGTTAFQFANQGEEMHEMVLMRVNDDVTASVDEMLALPQEEAESMVTFLGAAFAAPGSESTMFTDLGDGRYVMICFVPTGATSMEAAETADGPPHFSHGMVREFTIGS